MGENGSDGRDPVTGHFLPGHRYSKGRPKGARSKLGEAFLADLYQDWCEHGVGAIEQVRERRPWDYLKVVASLMPRDLHVGFNELSDLSDDELRARIRQLHELVRPFLPDDDSDSEQLN
jgi:hypothetical protein